MSDSDDLYEIDESHNAIEIPQQEEHPVAEVEKEDNESDHLYDSLDEEEEEKRLSEHSKDTDTTDVTDTTKEESTTNEQQPLEQPQTETETQGKEEQKQEESQDQVNEEEEEEEDEYDPTAIDDTDNVSSTNADQVQDNEGEEDEDDEYDPISLDSASADVTEQPQTAVTPSTLSSQSTQSSQQTPVTDAKLTSELTLKLFSDPTFIKLSYADQQKRVLEEFAKLSSNSPSFQSNSLARAQERGAHRPDFESPMTLEERQRYNTFLDNEAKYSRRQAFKPYSRLYVGNLPANFSKENIFRMFSVYGNLLHISQKNTFAFLQYDDADSVLKAIEAEKGIKLYNKDLYLEVAKNSRPDAADSRGSTSQSDDFHDSRKRDRFDRSQQYDSSSRYGSDRSSKRRRGGQVEVKVFVKQSADSQYARDVSRTWEASGFEVDVEYLKPGQNLDKMVNNAAYSGVLSVALVNKNRSLDVFIYENTPDGGIRFDEYMAINENDALSLLTRSKSLRQPSRSNGPAGYGASAPAPASAPYNPQPTYTNPPAANIGGTDPAAILQALGPQGVQSLLSILQSQGQQQPVQQAAPAYNPYQQQQQPQQPQQAYNPYGQAPAQALAVGGVDVASLLSKLQPQAAPQQQQYNSYNPYQPQTSQPLQQQQQQQQPPQQPQGAQNVASLLASLSALNQHK